MNNIEFFNRISLAVFAELYAVFPSPVDLDVNSIAMKVLPEDAQQGETWDALQAAGDAVDFLAKEGFLTHIGPDIGDGNFLQARLTLKGLAILGSPSSLEGKQSLIEGIKNALAGGSKEAGAETVRLLAQKAFSAALAAGPALITALS